MQLTTRFYCVKTRLVRPNVSACLGGGNGFFCRSSLKATQGTQIYDSGYEVSSLAKKQKIKFNTNRKSDFQELFFEVQSFQKNQLFIIQTSSQVMLNDRDTNNLRNAVQCSGYPQQCLARIFKVQGCPKSWLGNHKYPYLPNLQASNSLCNFLEVLKQDNTDCKIKYSSFPSLSYSAKNIQ